MTLSLSGGSYRYNRFDEYEALLEKKKQGYNDELDDALGEKDGKESDKKQSEKDRRDESEGEEESKGKGKYSGDKEKDKEEDKKDKKKDVKESQMDSYVRTISKMSNSFGYVPNPLSKPVVEPETETVEEGKGAGSPAKMVKEVDANYKKTNPNMKAEEVVRDFLMDEGYATNSVSADVLIEHMSDSWFNTLVEKAIKSAE